MAELQSNLPLPIFPGFTSSGLVSDDVKAIAIAFNSEGVNALSQIPEASVAWAGIGTRVTQGNIEARIPVRLTALLGFEPFTGVRKYHTANTAAVAVRSAPFHLGLEWPLQFQESGIAQLIDFYGLNEFPMDLISQARAFRADMLASLIFAGVTNPTLNLVAKALTLKQPGYDLGLPMFSDGVNSPEHFSNPLDANSRRFPNLFTGVGKITDTDVFGDMLVNMNQVPHPTKANMNLGLGVTHLVGPTWMRKPFQQTAIQQLSLQTTTISGTKLAAATTNIYTPENMLRAADLIGAAGMQPTKFHIAPQLDAHPYCVANPGKQMWLAISDNIPGSSWAEFLAQSKDFTPIVTLLGDGSEHAKLNRKVVLFGDLDAGCSPGLPHFVQMYWETTPGS